MEASSISEKIQHTLDQKMRLNQEKMHLVKNIREKYKGLLKREKRAKDLGNSLFEPIVTPLKTIANEKVKKNGNADIINKEDEINIKVEANEEEEDDEKSMDDDISFDPAGVSTPNATFKKDTFQKDIEKIIGKKQKHPALGFDVEIDKKNGNKVRITTRKNKYPVDVDYASKSLIIESKQYPLSRNLAKLLFTAKVSNLNPSPDEIDTYNQILRDTNDFPLLQPTLKEKNKYYRFVRKPEKNKVVIKKLSKKTIKAAETGANARLSQLQGEGPNTRNLDLKVFSRKNQDIKYIYWNSPSELIHRLCLLLSTKQAGNTNPQIDEEIESIETQLREANIIE